MRKLCILVIRLYQWTISPVLPPCCLFYPSCSEYALEALRKSPSLSYACKKIFLRLIRCHPWSKKLHGRIDHFNVDKNCVNRRTPTPVAEEECKECGLER